MAAARRRLRSITEVVYLDGADSWIVNEASPTIRQVWKTDYAAMAPDSPFLRGWCRFWRYPAVGFASALDGAKWCLIHPVRGPLFVLTVGGTVAGYTLT